MLGYHHNLIQHTQLHFTQAKVTNVSSLHLSATLSIYQYILVCTIDVQVHTYTLHTHTSFQSGTIAFATLTSLLPTLVRCFAGSNLPLCSLLDSQAAQARLATSKLPQPRVNLVDVASAAAPAILRSSVCTTRRETRTLVLAVLVRNCWSRITIQKAGHQGDSSVGHVGVGHVETRCWGWFVKLDHP